MASSLYFAGAYDFYPIGNTTAVSLTRDLPPDVPADILLLPCGDPRNILYTVFCERENPLRKKLNFTCCDHDPGILARNVLLFTMIMDRVADQTMWNIFFHMYLDVDSRSTLVSQSQKLTAYDSLDAWRSSPYGAIIKIGTDHTFAELRRHWELYAGFYHPSKLPRLQELQAVMDKKLKKHAEDVPKDNQSALLCAGPLFPHARNSGLLSELHIHYWKTGTTFTDKRNLAACIHPNSTFFYSRAGEGFDVQVNTDPISPFHPAPLFASTKQTLTIADVVQSARSQFFAWTSTSRLAATPGKGDGLRAVVRFLLGDALSIARGIRDFSEKPTSIQAQRLAALKVAPWTTRTLELNREEYANLGAPTRFDVVDTSNVADYLGLLNIFLTTAPLLTSSPSSVLYTESFSLFAADLRTEFEATTFASLSALAILMDLAPVDALSGFTSRCHTHKLVSTFMLSKYKDVLHQEFTWKRPSSSDSSACPDGRSRNPIHFDTPQLIKLLHNIYADMFKYDDPTYIPNIARRISPSDVTREFARKAVVCPSHEAFVLLLEHLGTSLPIPKEQWVQVTLSFFDLYHGNFDFVAQLLRYGLLTGLPSTLELDLRVPAIGRLSHWKSVPLLIRVFLVVPRTEFAKLERVVAATKLPFPWLRCHIKPSSSEDEGHVFHCVNAAYGTLVDAGTAGQPDVSFHEDPDGRASGADLVFSFVAPSAFLFAMAATGDISVELRLRSDFNSLKHIELTLGPELRLFRANLEDTSHVHLVPEQPLSPRLSGPETVVTLGSQPQESTDAIGAIGRQLPVRVEMDMEGKHVTSLTATLEITDATVQAAFAEGAMPDVSQCSSCAIQIVLGGCTQKLAYPVPIVGSQRKLRLARKSSYIEVVVPASISFLQPDGLKMNPFPVVRADGSLFSWSLHRVVLDQLPVLNTKKVDTAHLKEWFDLHLISQISLRDDDAIVDPAQPDALANIKHAIHAIMARAVGMDGGKPVRVFSLSMQLVDKTRAATMRMMPVLEVHTLLFIDKVRFDIAAHAMVCDAFVVHTSAVAPPAASALREVYRQDFLSVNVPTAATMRAWKQMLPALAERCRTTWTHGAHCEYAAQGRIPLDDRMAADPLCSCGRGQDVGGMLKDAAWRKFAPWATRIALSPVFPVPYLEDVFAPEDVQGASMLSVRQVDRAAPGSTPASDNGSDGKETTASAGPVLEATQCGRCKKKESADLKLLVCSRSWGATNEWEDALHEILGRGPSRVPDNSMLEHTPQTAGSNVQNGIDGDETYKNDLCPLIG